MLVGGVMVFFVLMMLAIGYNMSDKYRERENVYAKGIALSVSDEISLAQKSFPGYRREFTIPNNIYGKAYKINMTDSWINILIPNQLSILLPMGNLTNLNSTPREIIKQVPDINVITKNESGVYLNV